MKVISNPDFNTLPSTGIIKYEEEGSFFYGKITSKEAVCFIVDDLYIIKNLNGHRLEKGINVPIKSIIEYVGNYTFEEMQNEFPEYFL